MDLLSLLLGSQNQERSITIKTKPNQEKAPPETPLDGQSANLPPEVLAMLSSSTGGSGLGGQPEMPPQGDPMMGQIPMDMAQNPYAQALGG
jgi:hypothetical protein